MGWYFSPGEIKNLHRYSLNVFETQKLCDVPLVFVGQVCYYQIYMLHLCILNSKVIHNLRNMRGIGITDL